MSKGNKEEQKWLLGESLNQYDRSLKEELGKVEKRNREQNHKISALINTFDDDYIKKEEENTNISLDYSKEGIVIVDDIKGNTLVNNVKDSNKELVLNGDIDTQGVNVTLEDTVDNGKVDVVLEGNTEVNLSKTKDPIMITHKFDDINNNNGKLQTTVDGVTTVNDSPGKVDIKEITGDTLINHVSNGSKELTLNGDIDTSGYSTVTTTEGVDGGLVDVMCEGNTIVNVCDQEEPVAITKSYEVTTGNHVALQGEYDGKCRPNIYGNTLVNLIDLKTPTLERPADSTNIYNITNRIGYIKVTTDSAIKESWLYVRFPGLKSSMLKPSTTYTVCFSKLKGVMYLNLVNGDGTNNFIAENITTINDKLMYTFTTRTTLTVSSQILYFGISQSKPLDIEIENPIILEGDYTNKPIPNYFTGMKSSFEDKLVPENLASNVANNGKINKQYATLSTVNVSKLKRNTKYTTFIKNDGDEDIEVYINDTGGTFIFTRIKVPAKSSKVAIIITKDVELDSTKNVWLSLYTTETLPQNISVYLVEGDYTNYDFTDYDSTKGGKYKVDYKVTGKNLFNFNKLNSISHGQPNLNVVWDKANQQYTISGSTSKQYVTVGEYYDTDTFKHGKTYTVKNYVSNYDIMIQFVISYKHPLTGKNIYIVSKTGATTFTYDKSWGQMKIYCQIDDILDNISNFTIKFQIEEGTTATDYEPYKESIKTLYLNSPLLEGDTIEQSGNDIIHNHRYGKVVLDGSDDEILESTPNDKGIIRQGFSIEKNNLPLSKFVANDKIGNFYCDKLNTASFSAIYVGTVEGICLWCSANNTQQTFAIYKGFKSVQEFRTWLQQNPVTVVYELATPTQEIISTKDNLLLDSYTNGHLDVDSVVPIDKVRFNSWGTILKYLYPNQDYIVQFESDNLGTLSYIGMNYKAYYQDEVTKGVNRFIITTTEKIQSNFFEFSGIGFNASKIVVTPKVDNDFGYFKGMKSVGECEGNKIEILSKTANEFPHISTPMSNNVSVISEGEYYCEKPWGNVGRIKIKPRTNYTFSFKIKARENFSVSDGSGIVRLDLSNGAIVGNSFKATNLTTEYVQYSSTISCTSDDGLVTLNMRCNSNNGVGLYVKDVMIAEGENIPYIPYKSNKKEILLSEPLRGLPNGTKDKYVIIDGKWYIERNTDEVVLNGSDSEKWGIAGWKAQINSNAYFVKREYYSNSKSSIAVVDKFPCVEEGKMGDIDTPNICGTTQTALIAIRVNKNTSLDNFKSWLSNNPVKVIYQLATPTYEPIDYNPLEVYTDITHISNNSTIPCNMVIRNSGYNTISLKENTKYTAYVNNKNNVSLTYKIDNNAIAVNSSNKFTFTTPSTLVDKTIRIASKGNKIENLMIIEGTPQNDPIGYFDGLKSSYECEKVTDVNDENFGKYKVDARVKGENFESTQTVYLNSPLLKGDKIIWKDNKLQHYHKMKTIVVDGSDDENWIINKKLTAYNSTQFVWSTPLHCININGRATVLTDKIPSVTGDVNEDNIWVYDGNTLVIHKNLNTVDEFKSYLQQNPITVVYELATPYYEEISEYPLKFSSIANCSLSTTSNIQVSNISFNIYEETLPYLYNDKKYYITFNSDISKEIIINLGGSELVYTTKVGFNKVEITTPSNSNNMLTFNGQGVNINNVKVTQQNIDSYFEGMKSVGECEDLEIVSNNKNIVNRKVADMKHIQGIYVTSDNGGHSKPSSIEYLPKGKYTFSIDGYDVSGFADSSIIIWKEDLSTQTWRKVGIDKPFEILDGEVGFTWYGAVNAGKGETITQLVGKNIQVELGETRTTYTPHKHNKQTMTHEPLKGLPNGVKDKYVMIDGKWYIERNCGKYVSTGDEYIYTYLGTNDSEVSYIILNDYFNTVGSDIICDKELTTIQGWSGYHKGISAIRVNNENRLILSQYNTEQCKTLLKQQPTFIYELAQPTYEPIDYNPFEVYTDTTHISNNSLIPANMAIKNTGYNCILKPNTKYTVVTNTQSSISAKIGSTKVDSTGNVFTIITPSTLTDSVLRLSGKGLTTKDIMLLEGDKTNYIPKYFTGMESAFEQEYDEEKNKYKVNVKVTDGNKENNITFYINEPLRGVGDIKDKIYVKEDKVVVERNCASVTLNGSDDEIINLNADRDNLIEFIISETSIPNHSGVIYIATTLPNVEGLVEKIVCGYRVIYIQLYKTKLQSNDVAGFRQYLQQNPITVVYQLATPTYEEVESDLSKLMLENYENSSLILNSNIPPTVNVRYKGEVPIVSATKELSSNVESTTTDINENIIPYMCDMDYRIVELQLKNASTQGLEVNVLGLDSEDVLFNNRKANKIFNPSYEMLKRDILSKRYSSDEYRYRLERYLLANKISNEEYNELEELINNGR